MPDVQGLLKKVKEGSQPEAWAAVNELVKLRPDNEEEAKARAYACACLAEAFYSRNKHGTAIDWWQEAVYGDPLNAEYRVNFVAHGLLPCGLNRQAFNEINRAIRLNDKDPNAWLMLAEINQALGKTEEAIEAYDKRIELDPSNPRAYFDRGVISCDLADWKTTKECCSKILEMRGPETGNAIHLQGLIEFRKGNFEKALKIWNSGAGYKTDDDAGMLWNRSMALLAMGRYRDGWRQHEARSMMTSQSVMAFQSHRGRPDLLWNNEPPPARLHVSHEMGYGDAICMARYLPILAEKGYDVRFEVGPELKELMQSLPGVTIVDRAPIYPDLIGVPEFDYHVPALSLPRLFGTETTTVPWSGPYLKADPKKVEHYRKKLKNGRPAVGLCWSAGIRKESGLWLTEYGKRKSIQLQHFAPIVQCPACHLVGLQIGDPRKDNYGWIGDYLPDKPTFADTAALIECLDLVVTVDTAVAHLAGALGKPFWLLMHTEGSWHWMAPNTPWKEKSPWYPTARIFRQDKPHEWDEVIKRVAKELKVYFQKAA